jgi:hypothetical protein
MGAQVNNKCITKLEAKGLIPQPIKTLFIISSQMPLEGLAKINNLAPPRVLDIFYAPINSRRLNWFKTKVVTTQGKKGKTKTTK